MLWQPVLPCAAKLLPKRQAESINRSNRYSQSRQRGARRAPIVSKCSNERASVGVSAAQILLRFRQRLTNIAQSTGRSQLFVLVLDRLRVLVDENFARRPKIKLVRMLFKKFPVHPCPQ